jgi:hypothetical protein
LHVTAQHQRIAITSRLRDLFNASHAIHPKDRQISRRVC